MVTVNHDRDRTCLVMCRRWLTLVMVMHGKLLAMLMVMMMVIVMYQGFSSLERAAPQVSRLVDGGICMVLLHGRGN